jgi:hypothetical protein
VTDNLFPVPDGPRELPAEELDALLSGRPLPADASPQGRAVSEVLAGLQAPPTASELAGEAGALAAVVAASGLDAPDSRSGTGRVARSGLKVAVLAAVGSLALGGVAAAATTGSLPGPLQKAAHLFGAPDGQGDNQGNDEGGDASGSASASVSASGSDTGSPTASPSASASSSGKANGVGPDATGPAAFGLCHAFADTTDNPSVAFRNLQKAAAGKGLSVKDYCTVIIALGPGHHPTPSGSAAPTHGHGHGHGPAHPGAAPSARG